MTRLESLLGCLRGNLGEARQSVDAEFRRKAREFTNSLIRKLKAKDKSIVEHYFSHPPMGLTIKPIEVTDDIDIDVTSGVGGEFLRLKQVVIRERHGKRPSNPHYSANEKLVYLPIYPMIDLSSNRVVSMSDFMEHAGEQLDLRSNRDTMMHEFVHFLDSLRASEYAAIQRSKTGTKSYYRSPHEFNAYYQSGAEEAENVLNGILKHSPAGYKATYFEFDFRFGTSPQAFIKKHARTYWATNFINTMNKKSRRHFVKRASALWMHLKDKAGIEDRWAGKHWA